ncbi:hypothetical protein CC2G_002581 [Coprinopsis cinerea AmutBmut pab1-1]|nr:hypothetical protein CC2G_002581 [Coprinopsis cinerea AmutBmut pab1-1]
MTASKPSMRRLKRSLRLLCRVTRRSRSKQATWPWASQHPSTSVVSRPISNSLRKLRQKRWRSPQPETTFDGNNSKPAGSPRLQVASPNIQVSAPVVLLSQTSRSDRCARACGLVGDQSSEPRKEEFETAVLVSQFEEIAKAKGDIILETSAMVHCLGATVFRSLKLAQHLVVLHRDESKLDLQLSQLLRKASTLQLHHSLNLSAAEAITRARIRLKQPARPTPMDHCDTMDDRELERLGLAFTSNPVVLAEVVARMWTENQDFDRATTEAIARAAIQTVSTTFRPL